MQTHTHQICKIPRIQTHRLGCNINNMNTPSYIVYSLRSGFYEVAVHKQTPRCSSILYIYIYSRHNYIIMQKLQLSGNLFLQSQAIFNLYLQQSLLIFNLPISLISINHWYGICQHISCTLSYTWTCIIILLRTATCFCQ